MSIGDYVIKENDNTLAELNQNFIYRNFKKYEKYKETRATSSQSTSFLLLQGQLDFCYCEYV